MKAISLWQPWASAIVFGVKRNETRHWSTPYRGPIAIHAAKRRTRAERECFDDILSDSAESRAAFGDQLALDFNTLPFGAIIGIGNLAGCVSTDGLEVTLLEDSWGNYEPGRYAWQFDKVWRLRQPIPCVGRQGFFDVALTCAERAGAELMEAFTL